MKRSLALVSLLTALVTLAAPARSLPLPIEASVGIGADAAYAMIQFSDEAVFLFEVLFDGSTTGIDMIKALDVELAAFSAVIADFGFGEFVDGLTYAGHSDIGFVAPDGYWSYWIRDSESDPWSFSPVGAADRVVVAGNFDGWRYPDVGPPVPEPATAVLVAGGLVVLARRGSGRYGFRSSA